MLDPRKLRLLRELARRGTIAAVAEAVTFTPSAVSQQLSALEREAGVPLLERTGRTVALTPAGHLLVEHAQAVLEELERAAAALAAVRGAPSGPLRMGAFPTAARVLVPAALAELARAHPALEPMVREIDPADVSGALRAGELDVALVHEYDFVPPVTDASLATEPLFAEPMYLTGRRTLGDARHDPWIMSKPDTLCHTMAVRACQAAGFEPRVRHHVDDFDTVLAFAAAGQGVALVPRLAALAPPPGVTLTELSLSRRTLAAFRRGYGEHPAIRAAVAAFHTALTGLPLTPSNLPSSRPGPPLSRS
ncbi:LysR family transcriptional regulator [Nonomuraea muscovyensis]|uniref:DNA-binding transcriptional LysR family regulator n=1 Tax=Nonomuraea muscovyensis TaxID=1124761 RepID=A0A7X0C2N0_9ACTN|nr:LysR family transcriptional regulator [Nonomuraea muscovyensis]MBB6345956.1 DNA-binding transcriptional LysR family regulator [Nonomuraea muscovyensis]MDF2711561.1 LysR family transcriptional regulator [Nonomuraea muscovyensis]